MKNAETKTEARAAKVAYVEFAATDIEATKNFFIEVFGWAFTDWGPDYVDSPSGGTMVGFYRAELATRQEAGGAVVGFYSDDLEAAILRVEAAGGTLLKPIFAFPGGERFHFLEPSGNEFIVFTAASESKESA
jgi:predicted enzyme related to lactoylglutathione lyase